MNLIAEYNRITYTHNGETYVVFRNPTDTVAEGFTVCTAKNPCYRETAMTCCHRCVASIECPAHDAYLEEMHNGRC